MRCRLRLLLFFYAVSSLLPAQVFGLGLPFDLSGPNIDVHVKRGEVTLPISETPNLLAGDRLWIHPDLPENQATHFVLVVAFLRGSTNPPPPEWFTRMETWTRAARDEGVFVAVPAGAQQALLFLAPETGGDFNTLRNAVRSRPGSFVRAAQDLQAASWERMRLEAYLSDVKASSQFDSTTLKIHAEMAARSLGIKINESCFLKPADQQASCLSQNSEGMVLDDTNAQSFVNQLTSGSTLDLMNELSASSMGRGGVYSPYVGAIVDTARILGSLHTAHFQYIPALALPKSDSLNLRLNMPPSFRNPKSVVVVALPPVTTARPEPLRPVKPDGRICAMKPDLVLPAEGAPLVFATQLAHDLVLHIEAGSDPGNTASDAPTAAIDLPVITNATKGGLVTTQPVPALPDGDLTGVVRGKWGFDDWAGPRFPMASAQPGKWTLAAADQTALVVGRVDTLHLEGQTTVCVEKVEAQISGNHSINLSWKPARPGELEVTVPLKDAAPGPVNVAIYQYGLAKPDRIAMVAYEAAASLERLTLSSGDKTALLMGTRLDEVAKARIDRIALTPSTLNRVENLDQLTMNAAESTSSLEAGKHYVAYVELKDGRTLQAPVTVDPPRPQVTLLNKGVQPDEASAAPVQLGNSDDLPVEDRLVFFLKSDVPQDFPRDEKVEVAAADSSFHTVLTLKDGSLMLEDAHTAVGNVEPLARFGASAFGPVRLRVVSSDGATGEWLPLGTLVRLPGFKELRCPRSASKACMLSGTNLFLAASFADTPSFDNPTDVPPQFTGAQIIVPHPINGVLYLKLRDDPETVQTLALPVTPVLQSAPAAVAVKPPPTVPAPASATAPLAPAASPSAETPAGKPAPAPPGPAVPAAAPAAPAVPTKDTSSPSGSGDRS